ncbi:MAG: UvrD-helicase domain-containing protein [Chloroflexi bacterium]|nr:UvrD-helicase domain-containing protein [Chloroflexota bacterium]
MKPTFGERSVSRLLGQLPNRRHFFWRAQPRLNHPRLTHLQPDFIVVGAYLGVVVLEIKDWVEVLEADQERMRIRRRDGTVLEQENPVRVAQDYCFALMDMLKVRAELLVQSGRLRGKLTFPVGYAVIFSNLPQQVLQQGIEVNVWRAGEVFGAEALKSPEALENALTSVRLPFSIRHPITQSALDVIRGVIDPRLIIKDSQNRDVGTLSFPQEAVIVEQSKSLAQQAQLLPDGAPSAAASAPEAELQPELEVRLIRGVAGSGKTLVLVERARRLSERYPDRRILVVTFNKNLANALREQLAGATVEVQHFHKLCYDIIGDPNYRSHSAAQVAQWLERHESAALRALNLPADFVAAELEYRKELFLWDNSAYLKVERKGRERPLNAQAREIVNGIFERYCAFQRTAQFWDWADMPHKALEVLQNGHALRHSYDAVLIDEAQDFAPSWIAVIKALLKPRGYLFMCEDPSQSIFRLHSWQERGISVQGRTRLLTVPYRSTRAISEVAHRLLADDPFVQDRVTPDLRTYDLPQGQPPVLFKCASEQEEVACVRQAVQRLIEQGIPPKEIAILVKYKAQKEFYTALQDVRVMEFLTMKGLEFRAVIVPHLQTAFEGVDEAALSKAKRLLFTAMTRAREQLYLTFSGELPAPLTALGLTPQPYAAGAVSESAA